MIREAAAKKLAQAILGPYRKEGLSGKAHLQRVERVASLIQLGVEKDEKQQELERLWDIVDETEQDLERLRAGMAGKAI